METPNRANEKALFCVLIKPLNCQSVFLAMYLAIYGVDCILSIRKKMKVISSILMV
jgi:hypothetical protein